MRSPSCEPTVDAGLRTPALSRRRSRARYLLILAEYGCLSVLATRFQQSFPHSSQTSDSKPDREDRFSDGPCVPVPLPLVLFPSADRQRLFQLTANLAHRKQEFEAPKLRRWG